MGNTGELVIHVVTSGKPKMLRGLGHKGTVAGTGSCLYPVMDTQRSRRIESPSPVVVTRVERGKPVSPRRQRREESRKADQWRCGYGGGKKRMPSCHGMETGCNSTRRESAPTALRCLGTRPRVESTQQGRHMSVALWPWGALPL